MPLAGCGAMGEFPGLAGPPVMKMRQCHLHLEQGKCLTGAKFSRRQCHHPGLLGMEPLGADIKGTHLHPHAVH